MNGEVIKNVLIGAGVVAGIIAVGKAYKNRKGYVDEHELIGDCEIISDETEEAE